MAQLLRIRQRLKAVATIKKITSAMRLIARSTMTQLNVRLGSMNEYHKEIKQLLTIIAPTVGNPSSRFLFQKNTPEHKLYICVGAQKGLCGNFNNQLGYWLYKNKILLTNPAITVMAVGKATAEFMKRKGHTVNYTFGFLGPQSIQAVTHEILYHIKTAPRPYSHVVIVSNKSRNFFTHELSESVVVPLVDTSFESQGVEQDFKCEQESALILEKLLENCSYNIIYMKLLASLLAEQHARFIAMDNATRNADQFLDTMKRQYNKLRQAKITRELTELTSHFQQ